MPLILVVDILLLQMVSCDEVVADTQTVVADILPLQMLTRYELESFKRNDNTNCGSR